MRFPIVIHKDSDSDYGVTVPDLPGCFSAGATTDAALSNAVEAIECHIDSCAARQGGSRSGLLAHAAMEYVAAHEER